jgi:dihydrofolate reductase
MPNVRAIIAISLDGYTAGPDQSLEAPLGVGGEQLHAWAFDLRVFREQHGMEGGEDTASTPVIERQIAGIGAHVMGRGMFGGGPGEWGDWNGWWGDDPPFHHEVFVLTHHPRADLPTQGGTTFHFATDGIADAVERARAATGDLDVLVGGGASTIRQALQAGLVDELRLDVAPVYLGAGDRLFDGFASGPSGLACTDAVAAPGVLHLTYTRG